jgi:hypothetical protein
MLLWGVAVIADSPQFSTLVAQTADPVYKGTAITIVICAGFAITIFSIQLLQFFFDNQPGTSFRYFLPLLATGTLIGFSLLFSLVRKNNNQ